MCLILWSWRQHPEYPLVLAANRDEFYNRPSAPATFWPEAPDLLAGRDLVAGGTWLGITRQGRVAAVTNYRDPSERRPGAPSRGALVRDFLLDQSPPYAWLRSLDQRAGLFAGFNLLVGDGSQLWYYASRTREMSQLPPGLYGLSNHLLDTPWPKVATGKSALAEALAAREPDPRSLFAILADTSRPADHLLPDTGVGPHWERVLAARFIASPEYGTRSSTVLLVGADRRVFLAERTFLPGDSGFTESRRSFHLR